MGKRWLVTPYLCALLASLAVPGPGGAAADLARDTAAAKLAAAELATAEIHVGKVLFKRKCTKCHTAEEPTNEVGPSLYGVVGRPAGTAPGYNYSGAIRTSGLIWTEANLTRYVNDPRAYIPCRPIRIRALTMCPGIHMKFQGFKNVYAAKAVVSYLKSVVKPKPTTVPAFNKKDQPTPP
jgi:cytochrome c